MTGRGQMTCAGIPHTDKKTNAATCQPAHTPTAIPPTSPTHPPDSSIPTLTGHPLKLRHSSGDTQAPCHSNTNAPHTTIPSHRPDALCKPMPQIPTKERSERMQSPSNQPKKPSTTPEAQQTGTPARRRYTPFQAGDTPIPLGRTEISRVEKEDVGPYNTPAPPAPPAPAASTGMAEAMSAAMSARQPTGLQATQASADAMRDEDQMDVS